MFHGVPNRDRSRPASLVLLLFSAELMAQELPFTKENNSNEKKHSSLLFWRFFISIQKTIAQTVGNKYYMPEPGAITTT
jgi:hypothetical protein